MIYRFGDGEFEVWLEGGEISTPNALHVDGSELVFGSSGDRRLKAIDLGTKSVRTIARLPLGNIDGITTDGQGNYLVSHWEGRVFQVTPSGDVEKLLDTSVPEVNTADFEYVPERDLLVIPTFLSDQVVGYRLMKE